MSRSVQLLIAISDVVEFSDIVFISEHWLPDICLLSLSTTFGSRVSYMANPGITTNNITRGSVAFIFKNSKQYYHSAIFTVFTLSF